MRARWKITLEAARDEAVLAVDLYNQPNKPRRLEGFFVHMHMAWLYLFQAQYQRDHKDYFFRKPNGRFERIDGEPKSWDLAKFAREQWAENNPVRKNLELSIALRNKIEHRFEEATSVAVAGYTQALLINYNEFLTTLFGVGESLGSELRFPIFVDMFTREGAAKIAALQQNAPARLKKFLTSFEANLDPSIAEDQHYEFRVHLIPKTGAKTDADVSLTFVRESDLSEEQRAALTDIDRRGTVIVREQIREVANAERMKPSEVAKAVQDRIPFNFSVYSHFPRAWQALDVRPATNDPQPARTKTEYCIYDAAHKDYLYTQRFVDKIVERASTEEGFLGLTRIAPVLKVIATS